MTTPHEKAALRALIANRVEAAVQWSKALEDKSVFGAKLDAAYDTTVEAERKLNAFVDGLE